MNKAIPAIAVMFILITGSGVFGQSPDQKSARAKAAEAVRLMDNGEIEKSLRLLEEAMRLDPGNINYPYESAYAHYINQDYKSAIKTLEELTKHKDVNDLVYQLLGNSYSMSGQKEKAIATYEKGLVKFPSSGTLYLERGNMEVFEEAYGKALGFFEKGIEVEPMFPSNYYWASKIYCSSSEEVWGLIYGEIFMNLERNTKRTAEISKLLFDVYKSEIKFTNDSSMTVSLCQQMTMTLSSLKDPKNIILPFCMVYEPAVIMSVALEKKIDLGSLNRIRAQFVDIYFDKGHDKTYPNVLFSYQKKIKDAGHMDAYNHWILMKGDETEFNKWFEENEDKWNAFVEWFMENNLKIDLSNRFYRMQY